MILAGLIFASVAVPVFFNKVIVDLWPHLRRLGIPTTLVSLVFVWAVVVPVMFYAYNGHLRRFVAKDLKEAFIRMAQYWGYNTVHSIND